MKRAIVFALCLVVGCSSSPPKATTMAPVEFSMKVSVPAGGEIHRCQFVTMPAAEHFVTGGSHHFTLGSHHLLLFRTDLTTLAPGMDQQQDCYEGLGGTIMSHVRGVIYGSQVPTASFTLPSGVGMHTAAGEVLLLQAHYLNASAASLDAEVTIDLTTAVNPASIQTRAGVLFYYDPFIDVPAGAMARSGARCTIQKDIHLLSVFPHYHKRGVAYQAFLDLPAQPPSTMPFYTSTDWEHPAPLVGGPIDIAQGTAIRFSCQYDNTSGTVEYLQGPSAQTNEMCMFTGMYYPEMDADSELCRQSFDEFGTGTQSCAQLSSCIQACPPGSAPTGLLKGDPTVSSCWQKCIVSSCPAASAPFFATLSCLNASCAAACATPGAACNSCALQMCSSSVLACQQSTCQ